MLETCFKNSGRIVLGNPPRRKVFDVGNNSNSNNNNNKINSNNNNEKNNSSSSASDEGSKVKKSEIGEDVPPAISSRSMCSPSWPHLRFQSCSRRLEKKHRRHHHRRTRRQADGPGSSIRSFLRLRYFVVWRRRKVPALELLGQGLALGVRVHLQVVPGVVKAPLRRQHEGRLQPRRRRFAAAPPLPSALRSCGSCRQGDMVRTQLVLQQLLLQLVAS